MNWSKLAPGIGLSVAVDVAVGGIALGWEKAIEHRVIEALVLAIIIGMIVRTVWTPGKETMQRVLPGIGFTAKQVLELAVCLLGVSVDLPQLLKAGPSLA